MLSGATAWALSTAEHGVTGGATTDQSFIDRIPDGGDGAAPFMAEADGIGLEALLQILHLTGEELDIGAADADPLDIDHDLARSGNGRFDVDDGPLKGLIDHERTH
jgi:hypothetical protein